MMTPGNLESSGARTPNSRHLTHTKNTQTPPGDLEAGLPNYLILVTLELIKQSPLPRSSMDWVQFNYPPLTKSFVQVTSYWGSPSASSPSQLTRGRKFADFLSPPSSDPHHAGSCPNIFSAEGQPPNLPPSIPM